MNILVFGGRDFFDEDIATDIINHAFESLSLDFDTATVTFVHGGAKGADTSFANTLSYNGFTVKAVPAKWNNLVQTENNPVRIKTNRFGNKYNVLAGMNRDTAMVNECDLAIGVWDGISSGTKDSRDKVDAQGKPLLMYDYNGALVEHFNIYISRR